MAKCNSLAGIQNEWPLSELGNKDEDYSIRLRTTGLYVVNPNLSNSSSSSHGVENNKKRNILLIFMK